MFKTLFLMCLRILVRGDRSRDQNLFGLSLVMLRRSLLHAAARASQRPAASSRFFSSSSESRRHVIAALVVNQPGCLAEIANLFAARGYNIDSLVVGRTEVDELSRMTVVVNGTESSVFNVCGP